jgi:hypothetical protein
LGDADADGLEERVGFVTLGQVETGSDSTFAIMMRERVCAVSAVRRRRVGNTPTRRSSPSTT